MVALGDVGRAPGGLDVRRGGSGQVAVELVQVAADGMPPVAVAEHLAQPVGLAQLRAHVGRHTPADPVARGCGPSRIQSAVLLASVAGREDARGFDHEDRGAQRCACAVHDASGNGDALVGAEGDRVAVFEVDQQLPFED